MVKLAFKLPKDILVACSGGVDSIVAAYYLQQRHNVTLYHFNHGTPLANRMEEGVSRFAEYFKFPIIIRRTNKELKTENDFRQERIKLYENGEYNVVTAHHLDDAVESYFLNFTKGHLWKIPMKPVTNIGHSRIFHPFLTTEKKKFIEHATKHDLNKWVVEDQTNFDPNFCRRNWVRNTIMPMMKEQSIGLHTIVRKQYLQYFQETNCEYNN